MFKKADKKVEIKFNYQHEGSSGSMTSFPLKDGKLLDYLRYMMSQHDQLVITGISDDEMYMTTSRTLEYRNLEHRVDEISDLVRNYIKSKAIKMDAYAIFVKGELEGVYSKGSSADFKKRKLIRSGINDIDIELKPITIN